MLRNQEDAWTWLRHDERCKVVMHRLGIMGHENTPFLSSACEHFRLYHPTQASSLGRLKIHRGFPAANHTNSDLIQVRIGLKS